MNTIRTLRILQIGDMQKGFTCESGHLYVPGASGIIQPANAFLRKIKDGIFDYIFIILDTHFVEEYAGSEEAKSFPIHCEYGTDDWELSIDISCLPNPWYLMKNQFNLWSNTGLHEIAFTDPDRKRAYEHLFHFVDDPHHPKEKIPRDAFIQSISPGNDPAHIEVTQFGVASDFCNRFAMEGWLTRGARVTIVSDLTKGIMKETQSVLAECQYQKYVPDRLRIATSSDVIKEWNLQ